MNAFMNTLKYNLQRALQGRYGVDELSRFLSITGLLALFLSSLSSKLSFLYLLALLLIIWSSYRSFSKNHAKRFTERAKFLKMSKPITAQYALHKRKWQDRKTHKYYGCPGCKTQVRIRKPEKHHNITITCPRCTTTFKKRI